ncbi:NUDIX domain-containing protein [Candidatus Bathyarchaeota archaeon]|nr:NUDIX domain-containing protein [Candidatus Bathyarchaeota archaeon]
MVEYLCLVDEEDNLIGRAARSECHSKRLLHRSVYVFVVNSQGKLLLQKRSMNKDLYPGYYTGSATGHVDYGETYEEAAHRELKEELGIDGELVYLGKFRTSTREEEEISALYLLFSDEEPNFNREEVTECFFEDLKEVERDVKEDRRLFAPGFKLAFTEFKKAVNKIEGVKETLKIDVSRL